MENINFEEIKQEIAKKHDFTLTKNDPILATVTMCEMVISSYYKKTDEALDDLYMKLEVLSAHQEKTQMETATLIINKSLEIAQETLSNATNDVVKNLILELEKQHKNLINYQNNQAQEIKNYRNVTILCCVFCVMALVLIIMQIF